MVLALAIFLDKNDVLPKWLAYMSIWMIVTELLAGPVFIFKSGPLAWNGSISFYVGTLVFVVWEFAVIRLLYVAIKNQSPAEQIQD
jgi:NADH:ubiquinone oxidoreductase subunit 3 (subunit A)